MKADETRSVSNRMLWGLLLGVSVGCLPALMGHEVVARVSGLYELGAGSHPYFQPTEALLLYMITPAVVVSSFLLYLSPGAILVLALGQARSAVEWVVLAFGASVGLTVLMSTGAKLAVGTPLTSPVLLSLWLGTSALAWLFLVYRVHRGAKLPWPVAQWSDIRRILWMLGVPLLALPTLVPKIFWENFNLDGMEAFEFGRSLTNHLLPYWHIKDGVFGFNHIFVLFAYPNHWFVTFFGPFEAAVRLPFFLYLAVLFAALVLLIEWAGLRKLSWIEEGAIWLSLLVYTVVQTYNTTYEPYFADLAEPGTPDTMMVIFFLSTCYALWARRLHWFWIFGLMTYVTAPGGLLLLGALAVATFLTKSQDRLNHLKALAGVILVCALIGLAYEILYNPFVLGGLDTQFSTKNMLRRLFPPTVTEFVRLNALLFPSGLLPALSLLVVRRSDVEGWIIAGVTVTYFVVIYLQSWANLHQFTPVMILPLVVFWRVYLGSPLNTQRWLMPAIATSTLVCLFLSLPRHFQVNQGVRQFGLATAYRIGDYERSYEQAVRGGWSLYALLPRDYRLAYPNQPWGTDLHSWIYYATREKLPGTVVNYVVQAASETPPSGSSVVMAREGISVYVKDLEAWRRDRDLEMPRVVQSALYEPIYRRTFQFFRAYAERLQQRAQNETSAAKD